MSKAERINHHRRRLFSVMAVILAGARIGMIGSARAQSSNAIPAGLPTIKVKQTIAATVRLPIEGELPSLGGATGWLNSLWSC